MILLFYWFTRYSVLVVPGLEAFFPLSLTVHRIWLTSYIDNVDNIRTVVVYIVLDGLIASCMTSIKASSFYVFFL